MKHKKKILIVGSGITGLSAALFFVKKNIDVEIFEKDAIAGGIIKDTVVNNESYLSGCQYLSKESFWYKNVPNKIKKLLRLKDVKYMAYCDIFNNNEKCLNNYPDLHIDKKIKIKKLKTKKIRNLFDKFFLYPNSVSNNLKKWAQRFQVDPNKLMPDSNRNGFMFSRIFPKKNKEINNLKNKNKLIDDLYGVPRSENYDFKGLLPINGYNNFFKEFLKHLKKNKIKIHLKTPVMPIWENNKIYLKVRGKILKSDYVLWTGNPVLLIKGYNNKLLDSVNIKIRVLTFKVTGKIKTDFYIQVFTKKSSILRLFFYLKDKRIFCSIECFNESEAGKKIKQDANKILKSFNKKIFLNGGVISDILQKRYSLLSINDFQILKDFKKKITKSNLIPSPWEYASSQTKLNVLESSIEKI